MCGLSSETQYQGALFVFYATSLTSTWFRSSHHSAKVPQPLHNELIKTNLSLNNSLPILFFLDAFKLRSSSNFSVIFSSMANQFHFSNIFDESNLDLSLRESDKSFFLVKGWICFAAARFRPQKKTEIAKTSQQWVFSRGRLRTPACRRRSWSRGLAGWWCTC